MLCYKTSFWFLGVCTWPWFEEDGLCVHGRALNWRFFGMMQQEHAEQFGGAQLAVVGSCGLHTLHNAFKCGFTDWQIEKFLRALHTIFHNVPARREDFCNLAKSKVFALPFCGHRWVENLPVVERALVIWPDMKKYVEAVTTKKAPSPWDVLLRHNWGGNQRPSHPSQAPFLHGSLTKHDTFPHQIPDWWAFHWKRPGRAAEGEVNLFNALWIWFLISLHSQLAHSRTAETDWLIDLIDFIYLTIWICRYSGCSVLQVYCTGIVSVTVWLI